jgi:hypothetical protein
MCLFAALTRTTRVIVMTVQFSRQGFAAMPVPVSAVKSSLLRRLLRAHDDPCKQRILKWLIEIDDAELLKFGLAPEDIAILRGIARSFRAFPLLTQSGHQQPTLL